MWWYVLQGSIAGAILLSDGVYHWSIGRYDAPFIALVVAWSSSFMLAWVLDGAWKISAPESQEEPARRPSVGVASESGAAAGPPGPPKRAVGPRVIGSGGLR